MGALSGAGWKPAGALLLDLAVFAGFVLGGRSAHDISGGITWFLTVLWPFAASWVAVGLVIRLYGTPLVRIDRRMIICWIFGVALALDLRLIVTDRSIPLSFDCVAYGFIGVFTFGWRLIASGVSRLVSRAKPQRLS